MAFGKATEPSTKVQTKYSDFIKGWAKKDAKLVQMIHDNLTELVRQAKDSKQRSQSHSFPTMNREKRQVIYFCFSFFIRNNIFNAFYDLSSFSWYMKCVKCLVLNRLPMMRNQIEMLLALPKKKLHGFPV